MEKGELKRNWIREELAYGVGALLYSPAIQPFIADSVAEGKFAWPYSLALCLGTQLVMRQWTKQKGSWQ